MKRILVIPGDGIGIEVVAQACTLLSTIARKFSLEFFCDEVDWGAERFLREGVGIPAGFLESITKNYDAILFGALGDPRIPDMAHGREILLGLRFGLDLFINVRPVKLLHPRMSRLRINESCSIDTVIFRENTEDIYLGLGQSINTGSPDEITIDESKHTYQGVRRIILAAFQYAERYGRKRVTLVDKSNAIKYGGKLWQRVFADVKKTYPNIAADHLFVDVAALQMVQNPMRLDVIVTSNLFGDILSDLGAGLVGGLGLAASGNINPSVMALFEPVHGSAPDIAGKNIANPFAMFLSVAMMMNYFDYHDIARHIEKAIIKAIDDGSTTKDLGGSLSCSEAARCVIADLELVS